MCDEFACAVTSVEVQAAVVELGVELIGGDGLTRLDDLADDVAQGALAQEGAVHADALGYGYGPDDLARHVVAVDGEEELAVIADLVIETLDEPDLGNGLLGGDGKDVAGLGEEQLAEVARGACLLAEVVVADEEAGGVGVVEGVADGVVEGGSGIDAAVGHEVVDVVDDKQGGFDVLDSLLDVGELAVEVIAELAHLVEAKQGEARVVRVKMGNHLVEKVGAEMYAPDGVNPEDSGGLVIGRGDGEPGGPVVFSREHRGGNHLGEVVGEAGVFSCDVGAGVLPDDRLSIDGDDGFRSKALDLLLAGDEHVLPRLLDVVGCAIM